MGNMKAASRDKMSSASQKNKTKFVDTILTFCWKAEISDFAAVQGCERHTRLPMSLKCAATETTFSGKKRENGLRSARRGKDNYLKLDLERTLITSCKQLKGLTGEQRKLCRQATFKGNTTKNAPLDG